MRRLRLTGQMKLVSQTEGCGPVYRIVYTVESGLASSSQKIDVFMGGP